MSIEENDKITMKIITELMKSKTLDEVSVKVGKPKQMIINKLIQHMHNVQHESGEDIETICKKLRLNDDILNHIQFINQLRFNENLFKFKTGTVEKSDYEILKERMDRLELNLKRFELLNKIDKLKKKKTWNQELYDKYLKDDVEFIRKA